MSYKKIVISIVALSVMLIGICVVLTKGHKNDAARPTGRVLNSPESGMSVTVDPELRQQVVSEADKRRGQIWTLTQPAGAKPEFSITAVYVEDPTIKKLVSMANKPTAEAVMESVTLQLQKQYHQYEYNFLSKRIFSIGKYDAAEVVFEYVSKDDTVRQRLVLIFKNPTAVVYIRGQVTNAGYEMMNVRYLDPLLASVKFE